MNKPTLIDFFCGAGGMGLGFKNAGFDILKAYDFDKYAIQTYRENIGEHAELMDIKNVKGDSLPYADVFSFGFPCQDISIAGKGDKTGRTLKEKSRSGLFYEIMRLLGEVKEKPKMILAENVKAVNKFIPTISEEYKKAGYKLIPQLYNSKYWGVPQNRERYYLLGIRSDLDLNFKFPIEQKEIMIAVKDVLEDEVDEKYYIYRPVKPMKINGDCPVVATTKLTEAKGTNSRQYVYNTNKRIGALMASDHKQPKQIIVPNIPTLSSVLESDVDEKYYIDDLKALKIIEKAQDGLRVKQATKKGYDVAVPGDAININYPTSTTRRGRVGKQIAQTLTTKEEQVVVEGGVHAVSTPDRLTKQQNGRRIKVNDDVMFTLTTKDTHGIVHDKIIVHNLYGGFNENTPRVFTDYSPTIRTAAGGGHIPSVANLNTFRIRKITPRETARLQGFPDSFRKIVSDTQFYKQMGNAVTVNVAQVIAEAIKEVL